MSDHHIKVFYSEEDDGWIADVPDLPMCAAFGESAEQAVAEVELARQAWLEVAREDGRPIPEPRYRPAVSAS